MPVSFMVVVGGMRIATTSANTYSRVRSTNGHLHGHLIHLKGHKRSLANGGTDL